MLATGLAAYKGKALVNSVNGEEAKLKEVLPLVAQYKAAVVALTMDDNGIPNDVPTPPGHCRQNRERGSPSWA